MEEKKEDRRRQMRMHEVIQASQWVSAWRDMIVNQKWSSGRLATELEKKCGFRVTKNNAVAILESLGIKLPRAVREARLNLSKEIDRLNMCIDELKAFAIGTLKEHTALAQEFRALKNSLEPSA